MKFEHQESILKNEGGTKYPPPSKEVSLWKKFCEWIVPWSKNKTTLGDRYLDAKLQLQEANAKKKEAEANKYNSEAALNWSKALKAIINTYAKVEMKSETEFQDLKKVKLNNEKIAAKLILQYVELLENIELKDERNASNQNFNNNSSTSIYENGNGSK